MYRSTAGRLACLAAALGLAWTPCLAGEDYYWDVDAGAWSEPTHWFGARNDPSGSDLMYVQKYKAGGGVTCTFDGRSPTEPNDSVAAVYVGKGNSVLHLAGHLLMITRKVMPTLYVGYQDGGGNYSLWGSLWVANEEKDGVVHVGSDSLAHFTQHPGSTAVFDELYVNLFYAGSEPSTYTLMAGAGLMARNEIIGGLGYGEFIHTGGTNIVIRNLGLGGPSGDGTYLLQSGWLSVGGYGHTPGHLNVGDMGYGEVVQTAGNVGVYVSKIEREAEPGVYDAEGGVLRIGFGQGGWYTILGEVPGYLKAGSIDIGHYGHLNIGDESTLTHATIRILDLAEYDFTPEEQRGYESVFSLGPVSYFKVVPSSSCRILLKDATAGLVIESHSPTRVDGLGATTVVFDGKDFDPNPQHDYKQIEAAGVELDGDYAPADDTYFNADNFVIGELVVGDESKIHDENFKKVTLQLRDEVDNQRDDVPPDLVKNEALYVETLTITAGGTFDEASIDQEDGGAGACAVYYLDGEVPCKLFMGDANLDGAVNLLDLIILAGNYNQSGKVWAEGDFNGDRDVNLLDQIILAANWQRETIPDGGEKAGGSALPKLEDVDGDGDFDIDDVRIILKRSEEQQ